MSETDHHRDELAAVLSMLRRHYADRKDVYVGANLPIDYEEGNLTAQFTPDVFVVFGARKGQRRSYRLSAEREAPAVVIEVTSRGTWLEDAGNKKALCARLGVSEYYLYDPAGEYLTPGLQGFRCKDGDYGPLRPGKSGSIRSVALGLKMALVDGRLQLVDLATSGRLLRPEEVEAARKSAEARAEEAEDRALHEAAHARHETGRANAESEARRRAEARAHASETELAALRARVREERPKAGATTKAKASATTKTKASASAKAKAKAKASAKANARRRRS